MNKQHPFELIYSISLENIYQIQLNSYYIIFSLIKTELFIDYSEGINKKNKKKLIKTYVKSCEVERLSSDR